MLPKGQAVLLQAAAEAEIADGEPQKMQGRAGEPDVQEIFPEEVPDRLIPGRSGFGFCRGRRHGQAVVQNRSVHCHDLPLVVSGAGRQLILRLLDGRDQLGVDLHRLFNWPGLGQGQLQSGHRQGHRHHEPQKHQQPQVIKQTVGQPVFQPSAQQRQKSRQRRSAEGQHQNDLHQVRHISPPFGTGR